MCFLVPVRFAEKAFGRQTQPLHAVGDHGRVVDTLVAQRGFGCDVLGV